MSCTVVSRWSRKQAHSLERLLMNGSLAQLVERHVYTVDVIGSIPVGPTNKNPAIPRPDGPEWRGFLFFVRLARRCPVRVTARMTITIRGTHGRDFLHGH